MPFITETTIHGVNFIFNSNHSKSVRIFWGVAFILSFFGFGYYVFNAFVKLTINPDVIMKVSQRPMYEIPFPAITICHLILNEVYSLDVNAWRTQDTGFARQVTTA
jgi:hypothetical protein